MHAGKHRSYSIALTTLLTAFPGIAACKSLAGSWYFQPPPDGYSCSEPGTQRAASGTPSTTTPKENGLSLCLLLAFVNTTNENITLKSAQVFSLPKSRISFKNENINATWNINLDGRKLKPGQIQIIRLPLVSGEQKCAIPVRASIIQSEKKSKPIEVRVSGFLPTAVPDDWAISCSYPPFAQSSPQIGNETSDTGDSQPSVANMEP